MDTTNSDNSEIKVEKVSQEKINEYFRQLGCENLAVSTLSFKELVNQKYITGEEPEQGLNSSNTAGADSNTSSDSGSTSSGGTTKAQTEYVDNGMVHMDDVLRPDTIQTLKLTDPNKAKETQQKGERGE